MNTEFRSDHMRLIVSSKARLRLVDRKTGVDYADPGTAMARVKVGGKTHDATEASSNGNGLVLRFGNTGASAVIAVAEEKRYLRFEVVSVTGADVEELVFLDINTKLKGSRDEKFALCALALNLKTNVPALPGPMTRPTAICYAKTGLVGASCALIGCPRSELREAIKEAVNAAPDLPHSSVGGPRALDFPPNRASYLFNFGGLTEQTVDSWIKLAKDLGIPQIDFHGGSSFRFGDCRPNPDWYPEGRASFKRVIDKLHEAGILAGLHTYAFFIDKGCPWVTPVPDPGLAKDATFTLAEDLTANAIDVPVVESTAQMSTTTGFFVRNSVTLRIGDELIIYSGVSKEPPYQFTGCIRGAYGTKASSHPKGSEVHHLKECFGLFAPDPDSPLFDKVVQATADFYNECGFDMIYLDALDGEDVLGGHEWSWHYGSKFVFELFKRLKKPPIMEMSTFHHHLWFVRSRMGAWDCPRRSYKRFIDLHCKSNESCLDMFLPAHLGWWGIVAGADPQIEPTFSDDIEYLCAKCAGWECGFAPQGFTPESYSASYNLRRLGSIIKRWEDLRLAGWFTESVKAKLREPGREFTLVENDGKPRLQEVRYWKHKITGLNSPTSKWTIENGFDAQPARLRIEALISVKQYDSPDAVTLVDFTDPSVFGPVAAAPGIEGKLDIASEPVITGKASGCFSGLRMSEQAKLVKRVDKFSVTDHGQRRVEGGNPSWVSVPVVFSPPRDLSGRGALGVWIYGDGSGEILNFQLTCPEHLVSGVADYYVTVDFTGWRYFELVEPEGERVDDYLWPYAGNVYAIYREGIHWSAISRLTLWLNNLPVGKPVKVYISPVKALPLAAAKLVNPSVTINGNKITFPVELETGCYIEYNSPSDCKLYSPSGELLREIVPEGSVELRPGRNDLSFACEPPADGISARARVTVWSFGDVVEQ
ncbi:MAG: hypothetical protein N3B12_01340 [Armatimonadetes bacterium]|nr:hypothetical protein [Armatimonadota bacterium]